MARKDRELPNAFKQFDEEDKVPAPVIVENTPTPQTAENAPQATEERIAENDAPTTKDVAEKFKNKYQEKVSKPKVEDTHTRSTFLFRNDLAKRLDRLARNKRGFKTEFINDAIEALLDAYENK